MSAKYLLDTNIFSEPLKLRPNAAIMAKLKAHQNELSLSSIVLHEMLFGCLRLPQSAKRTSIEKYLASIVLPIFSYDSKAAEWHAEERSRLISIGKTPSFVDGQIAAIAATQGLVLVSSNMMDFSHYVGLSVVDWRK